MLKYIHVILKSWDIQDKAQHFVRFEIKIKLPKLHKAREILARDCFGRILSSVVQ